MRDIDRKLFAQELYVSDVCYSFDFFMFDLFLYKNNYSHTCIKRL